MPGAAGLLPPSTPTTTGTNYAPPAYCPRGLPARCHRSRGFDRERMWYELLHAGFSLQDLRAVIICLQREIRAGRRYVGALKLCNLLQPDRFEEDLQISRVRLRAPPPLPARPAPPPPPTWSAAQREQARLRALECVRQIKASLR
ncbi:MAG: hypothetical protein ABSH34_37920 [Verrucomicrobiota bacterium]